MRRLILFLALVLLPQLALADASSLQSTSPSGSTQATLNELQPANPSLQPADSGSTGVAQSSNQSSLQQSGNGGQISGFLQGEGDNPHQLGQSSWPQWVISLFVTLLSLALAGAVLWWRYQPQPTAKTKS